MKRRTGILIVVGLLLVVYLSVYTVLSRGGKYEPAAIGLDGVKAYGWASRAFDSEMP